MSNNKREISSEQLKQLIMSEKKQLYLEMRSKPDSAGKMLSNSKVCKKLGLNKKIGRDLSLKHDFFLKPALAKKIHRNSRELNVDKVSLASYAIDCCELHLNPVRQHERKQLGISALAIVDVRTNPPQIVGIMVKYGNFRAVETAKFLSDLIPIVRDDNKLLSGEVVKTDTGYEFCKAFQVEMEKQGLTLSRTIGWRQNKHNKPEIEGIWGRFEEGYVRPNWNWLYELKSTPKLLLEGVTRLLERFLVQSTIETSKGLVFTGEYRLLVPLRAIMRERALVTPLIEIPATFHAQIANRSLN